MHKAVARFILLAFTMGAAISCSHFAGVSESGEAISGRPSPQGDIRGVRARVIGKTCEEVARALGTPNRIIGGSEREWWIYDNRFYDPITRLNLQQVTLIFHKGKLEDITFH